MLELTEIKIIELTKSDETPIRVTIKGNVIKDEGLCGGRGILPQKDFCVKEFSTMVKRNLVNLRLETDTVYGLVSNNLKLSLSMHIF
jgi:hypothetical protein